MLHEFCTWIMAKIRKLGYAPHTAAGLLLFLVRCMTLVCAVMDVLSVPEPALWEQYGRWKKPVAGSVLKSIVPAAYRIQRRQPA